MWLQVLTEASSRILTGTLLDVAPITIRNHVGHVYHGIAVPEARNAGQI